MSLNIPNLDKLIAHLEAQPPERINMAWFEVQEHRHCGTAGCIGGHILLVSYAHRRCETSLQAIIASYLKVSLVIAEQLAYPDNYHDDFYGVVRYPAHRVIATLKRLRDRFLATGEIVVDWGAEPTEGQPWAAPQAVELTPPALPAEITRFLAAERETAGEV
jgi:hypothetical protein